MAGSQLLGLFGPDDVISIGKGRTDCLATVTIDHAQAGGMQLPGGIDHPAEHRLPGQTVQDLGQVRIHAFAATGGENHDTERSHG